MKKFRFRLETVLKVRGIEMEQQAKIFALARLAIAVAHQELAEFRRLQVEEVARVKMLTYQGEFAKAMLEVSLQYRDELKRQEFKKIKEIEVLLKKAEEERLKLVEREKRKKVLEKLKERDCEVHDEEQKKMELKDMDELASTRWFRPEP